MPTPTPVRNPSCRTAFLVLCADGHTALCPFFGKCDGLVVIDPGSGSREFYPNREYSPGAVCDLIVKTGARRLVLGFVAGTAAQKLRTAGIDIRLGSCACTIEDLAACFEKLPSP